MAGELTKEQADRIVYLLKEKAKATAWVIENRTSIPEDKRTKLVEYLAFDNGILSLFGETAITYKMPAAQTNAPSIVDEGTAMYGKNE